ncbi:hypothetical protein ACP275_02G140300 [Erythranthe tilingii]
MGNQISLSASKISNIFKKKSKKPLPIETLFTLPSPLPSWPAGEGFASGIIDLGGLEIRQVSEFDKIWAALEGGPANLGATFFEPSSIPEGFSMLGCYSQPNNKPLSGYVLVGKDVTTNDNNNNAALKPPTDYTLVWSSESLKIKQDGVAYIWLPTPPDGYNPVGYLVTGSPEKPPVDKIRCARSDFTEYSGENEAVIWGDVNANGISVYRSRSRNRGMQGTAVPTGTFSAQISNRANLDLPYLKNNGNANQDLVPNDDQINVLVQAYSPLIYFHPDEQYFPSSVEWFFENGALLYKKGEESKPVNISPTGSNLPEGGGNDDEYWIDLPIDNASKERVKKGDLASACAYLHVKPMFGGTFTDIAMWLFYPFNGPARAKIEFLNVSLGRIGEHVGDWEHVTLRISNLSGELKSVYFGQHSKGVWVEASDLEFENGSNRPRAFSSLRGHASYPKEGLVLQGNGNVGIRNDSAKSKFSMDVGARCVVVDGVEPPWLNYARKWGPKISYNREDEIRKVEKVLPGKLKSVFDKIVRSLPDEVLGEEGPIGPKWKNSWIGDE